MIRQNYIYIQKHKIELILLFLLYSYIALIF